MQTYLKWLTRILFVLAVVSGAFALYAYLSMSPDGHDGGGGIAILYTAIVGALGFGISALAAQLICRNIANQ